MVEKVRPPGADYRYRAVSGQQQAQHGTALFPNRFIFETLACIPIRPPSPLKYLVFSSQPTLKHNEALRQPPAPNPGTVRLTQQTPGHLGRQCLPRTQQIHHHQRRHNPHSRPSTRDPKRRSLPLAWNEQRHRRPDLGDPRKLGEQRVVRCEGYRVVCSRQCIRQFWAARR